MATNTIHQNLYSNTETAAQKGYLLLDAETKATLLSEYGHMGSLGDSFEDACEIAEDRYAFTSPVGYVIAYDTEGGEFVAFAAQEEIEMIQTTERGVFDAIVDEAITSGADVQVTDGVARITKPYGTTIAVLAENEL